MFQNLQTGRNTVLYSSKYKEKSSNNMQKANATTNLAFLIIYLISFKYEAAVVNVAEVPSYLQKPDIWCI